MKILKLNSFLAIIVLLLIPLFGNAQVRLSRIYSSNMVLQREAEVPVWGWAEKGERITVLFDGKSYTSRPDKTGKWMVKLPAMPAGGPYGMKVSGKMNEIEIDNILVGDVWVCSGQSNMEWIVENSNNAEEEIASASDKGIRHFKVPLSSAEKPEAELAGGEWKSTNPDNTGQFTAVGYFFARELRKNVDVPIGLLNTSWGGSRIEPWMSAEVLGIEDPEKAMEEIFKKAEEEKAIRLKQFQAKFGEISDIDPGMVGDKALWADPMLDESGWQNMTLPILWENAGYEGFDGTGWFRRTITLTEEEAQSNIELGLGRIDDSDITWVNGTKVGEMEQKYNVHRVYQVDASILKPGKNVVAIRVEDTGGGGGIYGEPELMYLKTSNGVSTLTGEWNFRMGAFVAAIPFAHNQIPTLLYNKMIYPILDFPIKGALWYQGESNAGNIEDAVKYRKLFSDMIGDWRVRWNSGDFPVLFVQLANFRAADDEPKDSNWAHLRESQSSTIEVPNTGQAVIIDIGEANDIHPKNKQDVGLRLSLAARHFAYGEELVYSGPVYKSHSVDGSKLVIEFDHTGSGLVLKDKYGYGKAFAIAGKDKKFVWAQAKLDGDKVVVWNDHISEPQYVRYAWGDNPDDANLYNKEGIPASPFRTDK